MDPRTRARRPTTEEVAAAARAEMAAARTAPSADPSKRLVAGFVDIVLAGIVFFVPLVGWIFATAYLLARDAIVYGFLDGRSIGKKALRLRAVRLDGSQVDTLTSIRRNWPFAFLGLMAALAFFPILGWLLLVPVGLIGLGIGVREIYLVLTAPSGRRIGDRAGGTRVVEAE